MIRSSSAYFSSSGYYTHSTSCDNCDIDAVSNQLLTPQPRYRAPSPISGFRLPQPITSAPDRSIIVDCNPPSQRCKEVIQNRRKDPQPGFNQLLHRFYCIIPFVMIPVSYTFATTPGHTAPINPDILAATLTIVSPARKFQILV
ncbi:MAG: hypothetical protein C5S49_00925 [Candidatus Methanogaster sp.]|nr:MAG: hypothetical protein C5S49_00925 [ANME-2 cluster archaeon]